MLRNSKNPFLVAGERAFDVSSVISLLPVTQNDLADTRVVYIYVAKVVRL